MLESRKVVLVMLLVVVGATAAVARGPGKPAKWGAASQPRFAHANDYVLVKLGDPQKAAGVFSGDYRHLFDNWFRVYLKPGEKAMAALARFAADEEVELVELAYVEQLAGTAGASVSKALPDDPRYGLQWHLEAVGAAAAWEISTGAGVVVGLVDSGLSTLGEDLDCRQIVAEYNSLDDVAGAGAAADENGHGTHVAGTIAQCTDNGVGVAGVAPDAILLPVEACRFDGSCPADTVAAGIVWAARNGARVINLSIATPCGDALWPECSADILNEAIDIAVALDVVLVAAAGNLRQSVISRPGNHPEVIAVAALDATLDAAPYTNSGVAMSLAAPGGANGRDENNDGFPDGVLQETILDACLRNGIFFFDSGSPAACYGYYQGTSMAVPHVVGAAALLRAHVADADRYQVRAALEATAADLGPSGFDRFYGHGLVQIPQALEDLSQRAAGEVCVANSRTACLHGGEFKVQGSMKTFDSPPTEVPVRVMEFSEAGRAETRQAVFFESFSPGNFEVGVKMVDGCERPLGDPLRHYWAFFGGLTNADTDILIEDTVAGGEVRWLNPSAVFPRTRADTAAFPCDVGGLGTAAPCQNDERTACLLDDRFRVTGKMKDFSQPPQEFLTRVMSFPGSGRAESEQAVFFESFERGNFEIGVKVIDACGLPPDDPQRSYWVFYGGLTSAEASIRVTQTATGLVDEWHNPPGSLPLSEGRLGVFPCPDQL